MEPIRQGTAETVLSALRALYAERGYAQYRMSKFEEYDLYARNKDFLISDSVITFTDGTGKLLALKPDVTLSIVKNTKDAPEAIRKLYYHENVYRIAKGSRNFREIMQVGLECIGRVDAYCLCEVLRLAQESLAAIHPSHVLAVSHLGILSAVTDAIGVPEAGKTDVLRLVGEKNLHELSALLERFGVRAEQAEILRELVGLQGTVQDVLPRLRRLLAGIVPETVFAETERVLAPFGQEPDLRIDFSVVGDLHYYNGFIFKGFVEGVPNSVLSGGQYDMLMQKMNKKSRAIGFAVYMDEIGQLFRRPEQFDVDALLLYGDGDAPADVERAVKELNAAGESVLAGTSVPEDITYGRLLRMRNGRMETIEDHA